MKFILLIFFAAIATTASAQWYNVSSLLKKKAVRTPAVEMVPGHYVAKINFDKRPPRPKIRPVIIDRSDYSLEAAEAVVMKEAQHNMRFRVYNDASYNFSELAHMYVKQNRYSEAKWYLLQSNNISREENDDKHTIQNLIDLATIKANMGDVELALQDLVEAHDLAVARSLNQFLETIDLAQQFIRQTKQPKIRPALIYADDAQNTGKDGQ